MRIRYAVLAASMLLVPATARAQVPETPSQIVSLNPIGLVFGVLSAEYERARPQGQSIGASASLYSPDGWTYLSADAKYRFYPAGSSLEGLSLGGSVGFTHLRSDACDDFYDDWGYDEGCEDDSGTAAGVGVQVEYQALLGAARKFSFAGGLGAKRLILIGSDLSDASLTYPTLRLSVGYAF